MGFDGDIIGIAVTDGVNGNPLALKFTLNADLGLVQVIHLQLN